MVTEKLKGGECTHPRQPLTPDRDFPCAWPGCPGGVDGIDFKIPFLVNLASFNRPAEVETRLYRRHRSVDRWSWVMASVSRRRHQR